MITTIIIISILLITSVFININLLRKVERLDDELTDISMTMEEAIVSIKSAYNKIQVADSKGSFKSDDEVGYVFNQIKDVITNLNIKFDLEAENQYE